MQGNVVLTGLSGRNTTRQTLNLIHQAAVIYLRAITLPFLMA